MQAILDWLHWLKDWTLMWGQTPHAVPALFIFSFAASSFFPIPPDLLLIFMCVGNPQASLWYAFICTLGGCLGGILGYFIGIRGGKPVLAKFVKAERIEEIHRYFQKYEVWAIGIAGFTPIPYKVFSISAGVFYINFWKFVLVTVLSRGARFYIMGVLIMIFGAQIQYYLDKYFDLFSILFTILIIAGFFIMHQVKVPAAAPVPVPVEPGSKTKIIPTDLNEDG
jgi:membrane protein YqaA with SNARE-associated domain